MIRALIFDLDGTLIDSEPLKAQAYVTAVQRIGSEEHPKQAVLDASRAVVGADAEEAARVMIRRLKLDMDLVPLVRRYGVAEPWEAFHLVWQEVYREMVADPQVLRNQMWPHTPGLFSLAREAGCRTGLATMSTRDETRHVLESLGLESELDAVATWNDVQRPKPDPEIYLRVSEQLAVPPGQCLVLEDTPRGVQSALGAGMSVVAVATPYTAQALRRSPHVDPDWIVEELDTLLDTVRRRLQEHGLLS